MTKHKNLEGRTKVMKYRPLKDSEGRYLPYCDFSMHQGVSKTPEVCEKRECTYYKKVYIK